jgi:hypothetical protein
MLLYFIAIGIALSLSELTIFNAIGVMMSVSLFFSLKSICFRTNLITKTPSAYTLYLENLKERGSYKTPDWFNYIVMSVLVDVGIGLLSFFFMSFFV